MVSLLVSLINFYQTVFSPDHSFWGQRRFPFGYCRFYPSCSEYAKQSFLKYGIVHGLIRTAVRILRCNPFSAGGHDPIK